MTAFLRRECVGLSLAAGALLSSCLKDPGPPTSDLIDKATIKTLPHAPSESAVTGYTPLGISTPRDGFLYVPPAYNPATPTPLVVLLHGAGSSSADWTVSGMQSIYDELGILVLGIDSRDFDWDLQMTGAYGPDVAFIDAALEFAFRKVNVDPARIAIGGFSDGATEALGVGIANSGLFKLVVAFSPGIVYLPFSRGPTNVYVAHGTEDAVLSYSNTANTTVPRLRQSGFPVEFVTFTGGHELPLSIARAGLTHIASP